MAVCEEHASPSFVPYVNRNGSVNDIPDSELLRRAVGRKGHGRKEPRWVRVMDRFALGSTYARELCRRYGFDPDEKVGA